MPDHAPDPTSHDDLAALHALLAVHGDAEFPEALAGGAPVADVSPIMLEADVTALATAFARSGGTLRRDQWWTLRECAADARTLVPKLTGESWVYFARVYAIAQAVLRHAPASSTP
ncbi:hypothetical protein [Roseisolibacter agri]|uniref:Uncharacterized protein n=1 Tax=Roseisolibacter agri TaxID=2014610 RepID=A0AA37Q150_9BACT|nr:hypothetical protein [Roseisolibacter agri]GLC24680.1 hypothetical protein rosag_11930 [Roseisolibacter agri]